MATVLVVDDEAGLRNVLSQMIASEGHKVVTAENGKLAIDTFKQIVPDAVFLDIRLPDMDGLQILEEFKKINPGIPVIMCSGFSDVESAVQTVKKGAFDYISKPFKRDEVISAARRAVEARGAVSSEPARVIQKEGAVIKKEGKKPVNMIPFVIGIAVVLVSIGIFIFAKPSGKAFLYNIPYENPTALTWDGKKLWASDWITQSIYKHNIDDKLSIESTVQIPGSHPTGLAFDGQYLWVCDSWSKKISKRNPDSFLNEIVGYTVPLLEPSGLFWDGLNLWCCDAKEQKLYKFSISPSGLTVQEKYSLPARYPAGIFFQGKYLWIADSETNKIYKMDINDPNSPVTIYSLSQFEGKNAKLSGIAYDGKNIWACADGMQTIYKSSLKSLKKVN
ncbi:MAG: hypothetical protein A3J83_04295 [Elusimicrobia bacterium RIFOXYA2_FULL_40_6]|nr:MAG: hypothetical protein A3J83_04295 [Elusimicrobia bacterium RIFOXYA2_FULL_40_6]